MGAEMRTGGRVRHRLWGVGLEEAGNRPVDGTGAMKDPGPSDFVIGPGDWRFPGKRTPVGEALRQFWVGS